jgi:hypothetical protein
MDLLDKDTHLLPKLHLYIIAIHMSTTDDFSSCPIYQSRVHKQGTTALRGTGSEGEEGGT